MGVYSIRKTHEQFVLEARNRFGDDFVYPEEYKTNETKITITCKKHGDFRQEPWVHLASKHGCPKCAKEKSSANTPITKEEFVRRAMMVPQHIGKNYSYNGEYINAKTKLLINCPKHGDFYQKASSHLHGRGCPTCLSSNGEQKIKIILEENNIHYIKQHTFHDCKDKGLLRFDFFIPSKNIVIEFQGRQHYEPIKAWGGEDGLRDVKKRDNIKKEYCLRNNIKMLEISYDENVDDKMKLIVS